MTWVDVPHHVGLCRYEGIPGSIAAQPGGVADAFSFQREVHVAVRQTTNHATSSLSALARSDDVIATRPMMLVTEYRTKPGKREELFQLFERLVVHRTISGRSLVVWSNSATERDASYLFEYWNDADSFGDLFDTGWYIEFITAVDGLVTMPTITTVTVPRLVDGI